MIILALDPAEYRIGWALGEAGAKPIIGLYRLRDRDERTEDAVERFANWLMEQIMREQVTLVTVEHFLPSGALKGHTTDATREGAIGLNYAARAVTAICGCSFRSPYPNTIRAHFLGRASMGGREETKAAVVKMAQMLGYLARDCFDHDMADAAALFDFSSSHFGRRAAAFSLTA